MNEVEITKDKVVLCRICNTGRIRIWYNEGLEQVKIDKSCNCPLDVTTEFFKAMMRHITKGYPCIFEIPENIKEYCPVRTLYKMEPETLRDYCKQCPYLEKYQKLIDVGYVKLRDQSLTSDQYLLNLKSFIDQ